MKWTLVFYCSLLFLSSCGTSHSRTIRTIDPILVEALEAVDDEVDTFYTSRHDVCEAASQTWQAYKQCMSPAEKAYFALVSLEAAVIALRANEGNPCLLQEPLVTMGAIFPNDEVAHAILVLDRICQ